MNQADAEEWTQAHAQVLAGGWRFIALGQRLGVPEALGLTTQEWVEERLGGYMRMSIPDRREAVRELTAPIDDGGQGLKNTEAAAVLGVSEHTVREDRSTNGEFKRPYKRSDSPNVEPLTQAEIEDALGDELPDEPDLTVQVSTTPHMVQTDDEVQAEVIASIKKVNAILAQLAESDVGGLGFWPEGMVMAVRDHIKDTIEAAYRVVAKYNAALEEPQIRVVQ